MYIIEIDEPLAVETKPSLDPSGDFVAFSWGGEWSSRNLESVLIPCGRCQGSSRPTLKGYGLLVWSFGCLFAINVESIQAALRVV